MADMHSHDLVIIFVEFGVILLITGLLTYAVARGFLNSGFFPTSSIALVLGGVVLSVTAWSGAHLSTWLGMSDLPAGEITQTSAMSLSNVRWLATQFSLVLITIGLFVAVRNRKRIEDEHSDAIRELEVSKYFEYQAEERFRYIFDSTSNSVYCYRFDPPMRVDLPVEEQIELSHDAILQDCNVVFARELEADDPIEVIGSLFGDLDSTKDSAAHGAFFRAFIEGDYHLYGYELSYRSPAGENRALLVNMVGVVRDGLLHRVWAVENNIMELRKTQSALRRRREFQSLMADISSGLIKTEDSEADSAIMAGMQAACEFVGADRSTIFWLDSGANMVSIAHWWSRDGKPFGPVTMDQFPQFGARLKAFQHVQIDDVESLGDEFGVDRANLERYGPKSLLILPMVVGGETVGGISFARLQVQEDWTEQDVSDLKVFAELFANFVLRLKSRRALDNAVQQLQQATERLAAENVYLREEIDLTHGFDDIVGQSTAVLRSLQLVEQVAPTMTPVLIMGETGTGKELVARALHELSDRFDRPLVKVNCAALPASLIESELFGHEKGAFTGADGAKRGRFDLANGSTLFLDEIGEIPIELQAKLLRVLQEGEFDRLGGTETIKVDVRIVVATNRDLSKAVQEGEFRSDLYYRINTFPIEMPALRDRGDDIQLLAEHFVNVHAARLGREVREISSAMMNQLQRYRWPGNVRELEGIVQRAIISSSGPVLNLAEPLVAETHDKPETHATSNVSDLKLVEREHIVAVLEDADWKISGGFGAAAKLGIPPSTLRSKMKKLGIARPH